MAETACELEHALHEFQIYCSQWKLKVIFDKPKNPSIFKGLYVENKIIQ